MNIQDGIRIVDDDIGFTVTDMFINNSKVKTARSGDIVKIKYKINSLSKVVKTTDYEQLKRIGESIKISKKLSLDISVEAIINKPLKIRLKYKDYSVEGKSDYVITESINSPTTKEDIIARVSRLNDTVYSVGNINVSASDNIFIPGGVINRLKRDLVDKLNLKR